MTSDIALGVGNGVMTAPLVLRRSARAKVMRLRVDPRSGTVLLTVPRRVSDRRALAWAAEQQAWIEAALADLPPRSVPEPGATVPLYDVPHPILWRPGEPRLVRIEAGAIVTGGPADTVPGRVLRWLKGHARDLLERETREMAARANVTIGKISVGDPVSRWGSCSASGSIRYSWRLILAPEFVRRATVAHEVAHRRHMDHSAAFHAFVAKLFGADPAPARRWLRRNGASLHRFGRV